MLKDTDKNIKHISKRLAEVFEKEDFYPEELVNKFPHILSKLEMYWKLPEFDAYFNKLMTTDRSGRQGFGEKVFQELLVIGRIREKVVNATEQPQINRNIMKTTPMGVFGNKKEESTNTEKSFGLSINFAPSQSTKEAQADVKKPAMEALDFQSYAINGFMGGSKAEWEVINSEAELFTFLRTVKDRKPTKLGTLLVEKQVISNEYLGRALRFKAQSPTRRMGEFLVKEGFVNREQLTKALCWQKKIPIVDLSQFDIRNEMMSIFPLIQLTNYRFWPITIIDNVLYIAVENPFEFQESVREIAMVSPYKIEMCLCSTENLDDRIYPDIR